MLSCSGDSSNGSNNGDNPVPDPVIYMWVSDTTSNGNLGGVDGADTICRTDGQDVDFKTPVNNHRAVIADADQDPRTFFTDNTPVKRPDGTDIVPRYGDFFDPSKTASSPVGDGTNHYWTGISSTGALSDACGLWDEETDGDSGEIGLESATNSQRFNRYSVSWASSPSG